MKRTPSSTPSCPFARCSVVRLQSVAATAGETILLQKLPLASAADLLTAPILPFFRLHHNSVKGLSSHSLLGKLLELLSSRKTEPHKGLGS